jgi:hypothetical protein
VCEEYWRAIRGRPELVYVTSFVAESSYPEFRITGFIPTFRLSRLGGLTALFSLLLCGSGWSGGRDNREGVEEREERVGGLVAAGWGADRGGPVDRFLFDVLVGVLVDVGGLDALVAEPERDRRDVDALGLEQHRVGVSEDVRGDALPASDRHRSAAFAVCFARSLVIASWLRARPWRVGNTGSFGSP